MIGYYTDIVNKKFTNIFKKVLDKFKIIWYFNIYLYILIIYVFISIYINIIIYKINLIVYN